MTGELPKSDPATPSPQKSGPSTPVIIYWVAYAALIIAAVAGSVVMGAMGLPAWAATIAAAAAIGVVIWFLEDSSLNPNRDAGKDPLGRGFFAMNLHMVRVWMLCLRKLEWKTATGLPAHAATVFKDKLGIEPKLSTEASGFLWVAGERSGQPGFVVAAFDVTGKVRAADDLRAWPNAWTAPAGTVGQKVGEPERS